MPLPVPHWPPDWPEIEASVLAAIRSGDWGRYDSETRQSLCRELSRRFQTEHVRLACSGSAAIEIALRAGGVRPGDEVILAAYDYPGNFRAIELVGARPVLIDVEPNSACPQTDSLEMAAGDRVKAVIASHLYGVAADVHALRATCDERGWILIEDACQVPGMEIAPHAQMSCASVEASVPAGSIGHFGTLSFGGSKPLTSGSGGAVLTNDARLAARLGPLLDRPSDAMPLSPLQAAALLPQFERLQEINLRRHATARFLETEVVAALTDWQWLSGSQNGVVPCYYKVAWIANDPEQRQRIVERAAELGLPIGEGFHAMTRSSERRCRKPVPLPHAERLGSSLFVLDHTALLVEPEHYGQLRDLLIELHR